VPAGDVRVKNDRQLMPFTPGKIKFFSRKKGIGHPPLIR